jgi:hypothetical protein
LAYIWSFSSSLSREREEKEEHGQDLARLDGRKNSNSNEKGERRRASLGDIIPFLLLFLALFMGTG